MAKEGDRSRSDRGGISDELRGLCSHCKSAVADLTGKRRAALTHIPLFLHVGCYHMIHTALIIQFRVFFLVHFYSYYINKYRMPKCHTTISGAEQYYKCTVSSSSGSCRVRLPCIVFLAVTRRIARIRD